MSCQVAVMSSSDPRWMDAMVHLTDVKNRFRGAAVRLPLSPERWVERACEVVGRSLTLDEWAEHVPGQDPWQPTCPAP